MLPRHGSVCVMLAEGCRVQENRITCTFARLARPSTITFKVSGTSAGRYTCTARARVRGNNRDINRGSASGRILVSASADISRKATQNYEYLYRIRCPIQPQYDDVQHEV